MGLLPGQHNSLIHYLFTQLRITPFTADRLLLPQIKIDLTLERNDLSFFLMSPDVNPQYKLQLKEASLFVKRYELSDALKVAHLQLLSKTPAICKVSIQLKLI